MDPNCPIFDPTLLANSPDWLEAAPMRENLLASWRHFGQKQDPCPSLPTIMRSTSRFCRLIVISPTVSRLAWDDVRQREWVVCACCSGVSERAVLREGFV